VRMGKGRSTSSLVRATASIDGNGRELGLACSVQPALRSTRREPRPSTWTVFLRAVLFSPIV